MIAIGRSESMKECEGFGCGKESEGFGARGQMCGDCWKKYLRGS